MREIFSEHERVVVPGHDWSYAPDPPHADEDTHAAMPAHRDGWPTVVFHRAAQFSPMGI